jgi:hypothetical protein
VTCVDADWLSAYADRVLDGKPTIVLSYSVGYEDQVAGPVAERLKSFGFRAVLVGNEPQPPSVDSTPSDKVEWYFRHSNMAVFLATPDDRLASGEIRTRQNIIDEHRLGQQLPHLRQRLLVFKAKDVKLPSNINPVHERLPLDDPDWIVSKIVEQAGTWGVLPARPAAAADESPASSQDGTSGAAPPERDDAEASGQATRALQDAVAALDGEATDLGQLRRAELAIAALLGDSGRDETLSVHLANSLFARRHEIRVRSAERLLLIRTYLRHTRDDNVPGVYWLKDLRRREVIDLLTSLVRQDGSSEVRAQALRILAKLRAPKTASEARELLRPLLTGTDSAPRKAALAFIQERRDRSLRTLLDDPEIVERDASEVGRTAALLDVSTKPSEVMERYVSDAYVRSREVEDALVRAARRVRREAVLAALSSSVQEVRLFGIRMAGEKDMFSLALGKEIIERDRSPKVRVAALDRLVAARQPVDLELFELATNKRDDDLTTISSYHDDTRVEVEISMLLPAEDLEAGVSWIQVHGAACYEALGRRDAAWAERHVRRDLRNDFARLKTAGRADLIHEHMAALEARLGRPLTADERSSALEQLETHWRRWVDDDKLGRFLTWQFRVAALRVLGANGRPRDIEFGRRFADSKDQEVRTEALRLLERFGTSHDAAKALALVDEVYGDDAKHCAAETAFRLAYKKDKLDVIRTLTANYTVRSWAVGRLAEVDGGVDEVWKLLRSDEYDVRLAAAKVVWDAVRPEHADALLSVYMRHRHFYNVVRAIDRRLFAPKWLDAALPNGD